MNIELDFFHQNDIRAAFPFPFFKINSRIMSASYFLPSCFGNESGRNFYLDDLQQPKKLCVEVFPTIMLSFGN